MKKYNKKTSLYILLIAKKRSMIEKFSTIYYFENFTEFATT